MLSLTSETVHTKYCLALTVFPDLLKPWDRLRSSGSKGTRGEQSTYYVPVPVEDALRVSSLSHHAHQTPYGPAQASTAVGGLG